MSESPDTSRRRHLERLAWVLDNSIRVPFTQKRIGLDSVVGLVPGIGDAVGGLISTWILFQGMRLKVSWFTFMQMVFNVAVEVVVGFIPLLGDLFDMGWKANHRNVQLLSDYLDQPAQTARFSVVLMSTVLLVLMVVGAVTIWLGYALFGFVFGTLFEWVGSLWSLISG